MWLGDVNGRHAPKACVEDLEDLRKVSWVLPVGRRRLTSLARPRPGGRCHTWFGADGKVCIERWCLSPYVEETFNSKVIKSFVPELRSKCFSCFGIPMFSLSLYIYMRLWTFCVRMNVSLAMLQSELLTDLLLIDFYFNQASAGIPI